jgi:hypothetical protein
LPLLVKSAPLCFLCATVITAYDDLLFDHGRLQPVTVTNLLFDASLSCPSKGQAQQVNITN